MDKTCGSIYFNKLSFKGYLSTDDPVRHSNFGMWDQVKALQWVQHNIRNFGGDPDKVGQIHIYI